MTEARQEYVVAIKVQGEEQLKSLIATAGGMGAKISASTGQANKSMGGMLSTVQNLHGTLMGVFGLTAVAGVVVSGLKAMVSAANEADKAMVRLKFSVDLLGREKGITTEQVAEFADELRRLTSIDDEEIKGVATALMRFDSINSDNLERATRMVLDFAAATGENAVASAEKLGRALSGDTRGMMALRKIGISATEGLKDFESIASAVEKKVGGMAEAATEASGGGWDKLKSATGEVNESLGALIATPLDAYIRSQVPALEQFAQVLQDAAAGWEVLFGPEKEKQARFVTPTARWKPEAPGMHAKDMDAAFDKYVDLISKEADAAEEAAKKTKDLADAARDLKREIADSLARARNEAGASFLDAIIGGGKGYDEWRRNLDEAADLLRSAMTDEDRRYQTIQKAIQLRNKGTLGEEGFLKILKANRTVLDVTKETVDKWEGWTDSAQVLVTVLGNINTKLAQTASLAIGIGEAFRVWSAASGASAAAGSVGGSGIGVPLLKGWLGGFQNPFAKGGGGVQAAMAGMAMGAQIGQLGKSFGLWTGDKGQSKFGASLGGDEGELGATLGGMFGPWGAAIGGIVGGAIKHGADEGLATLKLTAEGVAATITKDEGGLGSSLGKVAKGINEAIQDALDQFGAVLDSMPEVKLKIRGDVITAVVGGVKKRFKEIDEAISFAAAEILKQGDIFGLSDTVKKVLSTTKASSMEELTKQLDFAKFYDSIGMNEVAVRMREDFAEFMVAVRTANEAGLELDRLGTHLATTMLSSRNALLGIQEDPAAALNAKAQAWNAEKLLIEAELELRIAELKTKQSLLGVQGQLYDAELSMETKRLSVHGELVKAQGAITNASISQYNTLQKAIEASEIALKAFKSIPLITDAEIGKALKGIGGKSTRSFGGSVNKFGQIVEGFKDAQKALVEKIHSLLFGESTTALGDRDRLTLAYAEFQKNLSAARGGNLGAAKALPEMLENVLSLAKAFSGGGDLGMFGFKTFADFFSTLINQAGAFATGPTPTKITDGQAIYDIRLHQETTMFREQSGRQMQTLIEVDQAMVKQLNRVADSVDRLGSSWSAA